jgi:Flp pilus assembly protein TadG
VGYIERLRERRRRGERGAALVEFAILAPLLFLLLFGIMEAAWAFSDLLDVRHAAREGARVAAVNSAEPGEVACERMKVGLQATGSVTVTTPAQLGDNVTLTVTANHTTLTSIIPFFDGIIFNEAVTIRYERNTSPTWTSPYACTP